jgi:hypothetical protein
MNTVRNVVLGDLIAGTLLALLHRLLRPIENGDI